jgi:hypothetical protein
MIQRTEVRFRLDTEEEIRSEDSVSVMKTWNREDYYFLSWRSGWFLAAYHPNHSDLEQQLFKQILPGRDHIFVKVLAFVG